MVGDLVRAHRRRLGLTQEALADVTGLSARTIRDIETGRIARPRPGTVRLLADAFDLTGPDREGFHEAAAPPADPADPPEPGRSGLGLSELGPAELGPSALGPDDGSRRRPTPAQLPADVPSFTGRTRPLEQLDALVAASGGTPTATVIVTVTGTAGVGKTAFAVHWAHRVAGRFTDGQFYVNLRGFGPDRTVVDPAQVIRAFLDALGVPPDRIPADPTAGAALFRSLLAGRRMLVLLDNARDADQVRSLLPGAGGCVVLITSRSPLTGLIATEDAHPVALDLLAADEAADMLARRLSYGRIAAEPDAVREIVELSVGLPLALGVVAAQAASHPASSLAALAAELRDRGRGLDRFDRGDPDVGVRAVFSWSYHALSADAARLFRQLGLQTGPDIGTAAAASLAGVPVTEAAQLLAELARSGLVTEHALGRHTYHDLLCGYAEELANALDSESERAAAMLRFLDHYLHTGHAADLLLEPHRDPIALDEVRAGVTVERLASDEQALAWLTAEHQVMLAAIRRAAELGYHSHVWRLAWVLADFFDRRGHWRDWAETHTIAVQAARQADDPGAQAYAHRGVARAYLYLGRWEDAHTELRQALDLYGQVGDAIRQAHTYLNRAELLDRQGRHREALRDGGRALRLYRTAGHRAGQANSLNSVGYCLTQLGHHRWALQCCRRALAKHREIGYLVGEAETWDSLGVIHHRLGEHDDACGCFGRALQIYGDLGDRSEEAATLTHLGASHLAAGRGEAARAAWRRALAILDELGHADADDLRARLARLA